MSLWPKSPRVQSLQLLNLLIIQRWFSCYIRYGIEYTSVINPYLKYRVVSEVWNNPHLTDVDHSHSLSMLNLLIIQRWFSCYIRYGIKYTSVINPYLKYRVVSEVWNNPNLTDVDHSHSLSICLSGNP